MTTIPCGVSTAHDHLTSSERGTDALLGRHRLLSMLVVSLLCACGGNSNSATTGSSGNETSGETGSATVGFVAPDSDEPRTGAGTTTSSEDTQQTTGSGEGTSTGATGESSTGTSTATGGATGQTGESTGSTGDTSGTGGTSPPPSPICDSEQVDVTVELLPPNILLVVDRSGSMGGTKWTQTKAAIQSVLGDLGNAVSAGILMYPAVKGCTVPAEPQVVLAPNQSTAIVNAMDTTGTGGSTPMGRAMKVARTWLEGQALVGETAVVLAADGKPTDTCLEDCTGCDCTDPATCLWCADLIDCMYAEVEKQVEALQALGIKTYVVGFEGGFGATDFLISLATKGGTAEAGSSPFYDAQDGSALADALTEITGTVETCKAQFIPPESYDYIVVTVDGQPVAKDASHQNGWDQVDAQTVRLYGDACAAASEGDAEVVVTFVCKQG